MKQTQGIIPHLKTVQIPIKRLVPNFYHFHLYYNN